MTKPFSSFFHFLTLIFSLKKGIIFLVKYPNQEDLKDGYFKRVKQIDNALVNFTRIYIEKDSHHYSIQVIEQEVFKFKLTYSSAIFGKLMYIATLAILILRFGRVYSHSIFCLLHPLYRFLFKIGRHSILDFHGVVPEESIMMNQGETETKKLNELETFAVKTAGIIIAVTENMVTHIQTKYDLKQNQKDFLVIPIFNRIPSLAKEKFNLKDPKIVIYCGGLQVWQQIEKMLTFVNQHKTQFNFIFLVPEPNRLGDSYYHLFKEPFPGIIHSASPQEVMEWYQKASYGLIFREDNIVNRVACPTKLIEYMQNAIIPIVDSAKIGDFQNLNYQYISYQAEQYPNVETWRDMALTNQEIIEALYTQILKIDSIL